MGLVVGPVATAASPSTVPTSAPQCAPLLSCGELVDSSDFADTPRYTATGGTGNGTAPLANLGASCHHHQHHL